MARAVKRQSRLALKAPRPGAHRQGEGRCAPGPPPRTTRPLPWPVSELRQSRPLGAGDTRGFPGQGRRRGRRAAGGGRARGGGGRTGGGSGPRGGGSRRRAGFLMQSGGGGGARARGRGLSPPGCAPPSPFARLLCPGRAAPSSCRPARRGRRGREEPPPAGRPPCARAAGLPDAPPGRSRKIPKFVAAGSRRPPGARGPSCFPVLLANFARLPRGPHLGGGRGRGAQRSGRPSGHGREPERGRGAGARSASWAAAALRGADLPAGASPTAACRVRAPACGWSCR